MTPFARPRNRTRGATNQSGTDWGSPNVGVEGETIVQAALVNDSGSTGDKLVAWSFPLPAGETGISIADVSARKVRVLVGGVEQSIFSKVARGDHIDQKARAVVIQMPWTFADSTPVSCEVRYGVTRETEDLTETEMTETMTFSPVMIVPTDPAYLCTTRLSMQSLIVATDDDTEMVPLYQTVYDTQFAALEAMEEPYNLYAANYDIVRCYLAQWARTADLKYLRLALRQGNVNLHDWIGKGTPEIFNPQGRDGNATIRSEPYMQNRLGTALLYYITGDHYFWLYGDWHSQRGFNGHETRAHAVDPVTGWIDGGNENAGYAQNPRYNLTDAWLSMAATRFHFTLPEFTDNGGPRTVDFTAEVQWIVDAIVENKFSRSALNPSDWRAEMVGVSGLVAAGEDMTVDSSTSNTVTATFDSEFASSNPLTTNQYQDRWVNIKTGAYTWEKYKIASHTSGSTATFTIVGTFATTPTAGMKLMLGYGIGDTPAFQVALFTQFLITVYTEFLADSRLPGMIQTNTDLLITNCVLLEPGDINYGAGDAEYGFNYILTDVAGFRFFTSGDNETGTYTMPMLSSLAGFCFALTADPDYRTWLDRFGLSDNVAGLFTPGNYYANGKFFPECFGNTMDTPFWRKGTFPSLLPPASVPALPVYED